MTSDAPKITELVDEVDTTQKLVDATLKVKTDLTFANAKLYEQIFGGYLDRTARDICLDLSEVRYVDSTGISLLVQLSKALEERGSLLILQNLQEGVLKVLEMLKLDRVIRIA